MNISNITKTIVVTGANKGIGFGLVKGLLMSKKSQNARIILTSRNPELGKQSFDSLQKDCSSYNALERLIYQQLDITDSKSQDNFCSWVTNTYGKINILVNNAGVAVKGDKFDTEVFDWTMKTNYYETVNFTEKMLKQKLVSDKIIFVSSMASRFLKFGNKDIKARWLNENITADDIMILAGEFREAIKNNNVDKAGWPQNTYSVSKLCLSSYVKYLSKRQDVVEQNLQIYSCCPGWVQTDMGGKSAHKTIEQGIVTPMYLVELEANSIQKELQGQFFEDCKVSYVLS